MQAWNDLAGQNVQISPKKNKKKRKKNKEKNDNESGSGKKTILDGVKKAMDRQLHSPGMTENLIEPKEKGSLLKRGIKFASESEFLEFISGGSKKKKKAKKRESESEQDHEESPPTKKLKQGFDVEKLKSVFSGEKVGKKSAEKSNEKSGSSVIDSAKAKLKSSRFRYLNELLYTQEGKKSYQMFKSDPEAFNTYHEGFSEQVKKWPINPLDSIINAIMKKSGNPVIADFGCGEAKLARTLSGSCGKIHSFDLVALNDLVTVCDFSKTPLKEGTVDIAVFCLALMGPNLRDYLTEANRVLKMNGTLKIAEVESRFGDLSVDKFVGLVEKLGFKLKWKDLKHEYFYFMDFKKVGDCKKKGQEFSLKPCIYKKR